MAKSKLVNINKKIEEHVVKGYETVEQTVVNGYKKIEDKFVDQYLTHGDETVEEAKQRLHEETLKRKVESEVKHK